MIGLVTTVGWDADFGPGRLRDRKHEGVGGGWEGDVIFWAVQKSRDYVNDPLRCPYITVMLTLVLIKQ